MESNFNAGVHISKALNSSEKGRWLQNENLHRITSEIERVLTDQGAMKRLELVLRRF